MLTPRQRLRPLMRHDRELMQILGCTEKEYRWYMRECLRFSRQSASSSDPQAFLGLDPVTLFFVNLAIGLLFSVASYLLTPRPPSGSRSPDVRITQKDGQDIVTGDRFSAKSGFDSVQNVVEIGSIVPMIYAKRERIGGIDYGGVRVNTNLLWSQLLSLGGNQLFRGIFLIGQGGVGAIDPLQFAIGDNLLSGYGLDFDGLNAAKVTFYARLNGGRLVSGDRVSGREASEDDGNYQAQRGAPDIFYVNSENNSLQPDACSTIRPSTQTSFGLYAPIGSCLSYRVNPSIRPAFQPQTIIRQQGEFFVIQCNLDPQVQVDRWLHSASFHPRMEWLGKGDGEFTLNKGDTVTLRLGTGTDADHSFRLEEFPNARDEAPTQRTAEADASCLAAGQAVAARQRAADDALVVGERYLIGTAIGICIGRSENKFSSRAEYPEFDGDQQPVEATFRIISAGKCDNRSTWSQTDKTDPIERPLLTASERLQTFKIAIASIALGRKAKVIEVGIRSTLGIQISGLCNFVGTYSWPKADYWGCLRYQYDRDQAKPSGASGYNGVAGWPVYRTAKGPDNSSVNLNFQVTVNPATGVGTINQNVGVVNNTQDDQSKADYLRVINYQSGVIQTTEERYSFWRIKYRRSGTNNGWTKLNNFYGTRSNTQQPIYNYVRIEFPSLDDWEFEFEPVSGWEARRRADALYVFDFKEPDISVTDAGLRLWFNGEKIGLARRNFRINYFERRIFNEEMKRDIDGLRITTAIGLPQALSDSIGGEEYENYVDGWDKLSEIFIYDEITTTVQQGPEHEISYVNIIEDNPSAPQYNDLAIAGMSLRAGPELTQLSQLSAYVTQGLANTHLFPEVLYDMLTNSAYSSRGLLSPEQINSASFAETATFTRNRRYFCDIAISDPVNRRDWGSEVAPNYLLELVSRNGRIALQQAFYFDRAEPITTLFTLSNIIEGSFELNKVDLSERLPIQVSVRWRQERQGTTTGDRGIFPLIREVTVREAGVPDDAIIVRIDMSDYCTSQVHAIDAAKYRCRQARLQTEAVRFRTFPQYAAVEPGRCFRVAVDNVIYSASTNGAIDALGNITPPLADGQYDVLVWSSGQQQAQETVLTVSSGMAINLSNALFTVRSVETRVITAKAAKISLNEDAEVEIEGVAFPVGENGYSLFADGFDDPSRWIIEGAV